MSITLHQPGSGAPQRLSAIGVEVLHVQHSPDVLINSWVVERPSSVYGLPTVEGTIEVSWKFAYPAPRVWRYLKDFNLWQNRYGYHWDGVVGDLEGYVVNLSDRAKRSGRSIPYLVRKVVPEHLIFLESPPYPMMEGKGSWSGHNVFSLSERNGETLLAVFMEHTWRAQDETRERLRANAQGAVDAALKFWRESFIPDLEALVSRDSGQQL